MKSALLEIAENVRLILRIIVEPLLLMFFWYFSTIGLIVVLPDWIINFIRSSNFILYPFVLCQLLFSFGLLMFIIQRGYSRKISDKYIGKLPWLK